MKQVTIKCDKCKELIHSDMPVYEVHLWNGDVKLDLCDKCYTDLMLTVGSWLKE